MKGLIWILIFWKGHRMEHAVRMPLSYLPPEEEEEDISLGS